MAFTERAVAFPWERKRELIFPGGVRLYGFMPLVWSSVVGTSSVCTTSRSNLSVVLCCCPRTRKYISGHGGFGVHPSRSSTSTYVHGCNSYCGIASFNSRKATADPVSVYVERRRIDFNRTIILLTTHCGISSRLGRSIGGPSVHGEPTSTSRTRNSQFFRLRRTFAPRRLTVLNPHIGRRRYSTLR